MDVNAVERGGISAYPCRVRRVAVDFLGDGEHHHFLGVNKMVGGRGGDGIFSNVCEIGRVGTGRVGIGRVGTGGRRREGDRHVPHDFFAHGHGAVDAQGVADDETVGRAEVHPARRGRGDGVRAAEGVEAQLLLRGAVDVARVLNVVEIGLDSRPRVGIDGHLGHLVQEPAQAVKVPVLVPQGAGIRSADARHPLLPLLGVVEAVQPLVHVDPQPAAHRRVGHFQAEIVCAVGVGVKSLRGTVGVADKAVALPPEDAAVFEGVGLRAVVEKYAVGVRGCAFHPLVGAPVVIRIIRAAVWHALQVVERTAFGIVDAHTDRHTRQPGARLDFVVRIFLVLLARFEEGIVTGVGKQLHFDAQVAGIEGVFQERPFAEFLALYARHVRLARGEERSFGRKVRRGGVEQAAAVIRELGQLAPRHGGGLSPPHDAVALVGIAQHGEHMAVACRVVKVLRSASARGGVEREVLRSACNGIVYLSSYVLIDDVKFAVGIVALDAVHIVPVVHVLMLKPRKLPAEGHLVSNSPRLSVGREVDAHGVGHLVDRERLRVGSPADGGRRGGGVVERVKVVHPHLPLALHQAQCQRLEDALDHLAQRRGFAVLVKEVVGHDGQTVERGAVAVGLLGEAERGERREVERVVAQAGALHRRADNGGERQHARALELQAVEDAKVGEGERHGVMGRALVGLFVELGVERAAPEEAAFAQDVEAHRARFDGVEVGIRAVARAFNLERRRGSLQRFLLVRLVPFDDEGIFGLEAQLADVSKDGFGLLQDVTLPGNAFARDEGAGITELVLHGEKKRGMGKEMNHGMSRNGTESRLAFRELRYFRVFRG